MNTYQEVLKVLYRDGFHKAENHDLWKLKHKLTNEEWMSVRHLFKFYNHTDKNLKNVHYFGWMTTKPVDVILKLKTKDGERLC